VTPYYLIKNTTFSAASGVVSANFSVTKIINDPALAKDIQRVSLYVNKTQFVSGADAISHSDMAGTSITDMNNVSLNVTVLPDHPTTYPTQDYVYARVGLKIAGVEDMIFSPVVKIKFQ